MAGSDLSVSPCPSGYSDSPAVTSKSLRSPVWKYFSWEEAIGKSVCQVVGKDGEVCSEPIKNKYPTNLKQHLRSRHPIEYSKVLEIEASIKKAKDEAESKRAEICHKSAAAATSKQLTLTQTLSASKQYKKESERYRIITRKLAIFVGSNNVANSIVESPEFTDLLRTLDAKYKVPGRKVVGQETEKVLIEIKAKASAFLQEAAKVSICADIWSKRGLTASFLGVTAHFFSRRDHKRHTLTMAVRRMPSPHTAANVRKLIERVLEEWNIPLSKVFVIVTDNGSNMVAAFKQQPEERDSVNDDEVGEEDASSESEGDDEENTEDDFDEKELEHDSEFILMRRIGCFAHTLQLVAQKFDGYEGFSNVIRAARKINSKVNSSCKATERLIQFCGKKLLKECRTRWNSTYLLLQRLIELREPLAAVLRELEWDDLAASEWRTLVLIQSLLQPFAEFTALVSGENFTTISSVIPTIMELNIHLEEMKSEEQLEEVAGILQRDLRRRFRKFTDPSSENHNPFFIVATLLDPRYRLALNPVLQAAAKKYLVKEINDMVEDSASSGESDSQAPQSPRPTVSDVPIVESAYTDNPDTSLPARKRFRHLEGVISSTWKEMIKKKTKQPRGKAEINHYMSMLESVRDDVDVLQYWVDQQCQFPLISRLAVELFPLLQHH